MAGEIENPEMSTINQIQLPDGSIYGFEDMEARDELSEARDELSSKADKTLATSSADGLMSKADKEKLDTLANTLEWWYRDLYKQINALANDLAKLYPVGSIYLSVNDTNPGTFIGGTWELVGSGKTLWGADASHAAGTTIDAGLPNMTGWLQFSAGGYGANNSKLGGAFYADGYFNGGKGGYNNNGGDGTLYEGLHIDASRSNPIYGNSSTVQPPAYVVYMWKRTA